MGISQYRRRWDTINDDNMEIYDDGSTIHVIHRYTILGIPKE